MEPLNYSDYSVAWGKYVYVYVMQLVFWWAWGQQLSYSVDKANSNIPFFLPLSVLTIERTFHIWKGSIGDVRKARKGRILL
jgi:hypothetical protein